MRRDSLRSVVLHRKANVEAPRRYLRIRRKAIFIDEFVDAYKRIRGRRSFPHKAVEQVIHFIFPGRMYLGRGAFKTVHKVSSNVKDLVLKMSNSKNIRADVRAYSRLPHGIRNRYFAKIYWSTRYSLLQKFGTKPQSIPRDVLRNLKTIGRRYGLTDIRPANIRKVGRHYKIVDASVRNAGRRRRLSKHHRTVDL